MCGLSQVKYIRGRGIFSHVRVRAIREGLGSRAHGFKRERRSTLEWEARAPRVSPTESLAPDSTLLSLNPSRRMERRTDLCHWTLDTHKTTHLLF